MPLTVLIGMEYFKHIPSNWGNHHNVRSLDLQVQGFILSNLLQAFLKPQKMCMPCPSQPSEAKCAGVCLVQASHQRLIMCWCMSSPSQPPEAKCAGVCLVQASHQRLIMCWYMPCPSQPSEARCAGACLVQASHQRLNVLVYA